MIENKKQKKNNNKVILITLEINSWGQKLHHWGHPIQGDLIVEPDPDKFSVFKGMITNVIGYFCNLIRAAVIPQTFAVKSWIRT